jgi:hypothetical protein
MTTTLIKTLPLAVTLLLVASGCEFIDFSSPMEPLGPPGTESDAGGGPVGPQPLYPFRPGAIWQYAVTGLDGSMSTKWVAMDKKPVMTGGTGLHQLDMAYPVRTTVSGGGSSSLVRLQQAVGDQIVNWREETFDQQGQLLVDSSWEPQQLEVDQSTERTRTGASWLESYTKISFPIGGIPTTVKQNETWSVVGEEIVTLPAIANQTFPCIVFQKTAGTGGTGGGGGDAGTGSDAGKSDAGISRPMLTGQTWSEAADSGAVMPKTLWFARGVGKVKEAGGGQPTEELSGLEFR